MLRIQALIVVAASLSACGGGGGSDNPPPEKNLFSLWTNKDTGAPMDMTGGEFSSPLPFFIYFPDGAQCNCTLTIIGRQSSGFYSLNSCTYRYSTGDGDPGCNAADTSGTYTKTSDTLTITPSSGSTSTYK